MTKIRTFSLNEKSDEILTCWKNEGISISQKLCSIIESQDRLNSKVITKKDLVQLKKEITNLLKTGMNAEVLNKSAKELLEYNLGLTIKREEEL